MDASENLQGFAGDPNHNMHPDAYNNSIITPGSYTFLTGALDQAPLKDQPGGSLLQQAPPVSHEDGGEPSSSPSGSLIGTLFTNNQLAGSFNASRSPTLANSSNSWELTINGGQSGSSLYAGGSNMSNILMNGSGMMAGNSTPTAQLLINGLQGGSFNDNDQGDVYYPPSQGHNPHAEAMQVIYVNGSYSAFHPDGRGGSNAPTLLYSSQDGAENNNNSTQQSPYGVSFLTPGTMSQRALEAAGAIPVMSLNQERHGSQSYHNWQRTGGNEHSFLPVNEEHQTHQSLFGAALGRQGGDQDHDLSHMHGEHLQSEVGMHVDHQSQGGNSNISVNGQGLLSLSLSSHQPHFQGGQLPGESTSEAHMVAQAAALAKTKELASRYLASSGANADLSRFRTPSRDDVMGSRYHQENHAGNSARKLPFGLSSSSNALTSSKFLQSVQSVLNELCRVTPMKRTPKPATSAEQHNPLRSSSASVHASYGYHVKEDSHADAGTGRGDPASSMSSLSDASHLVTVSHIPLQAEMMSDAARASGTSRDDLDFKKGQLVRMLDEVEARFRRYSEQLQVTCAGFNAQAGAHAATPYTILALQAMSRHFRCLKDAVKIQLKVVRRALGEEEISAGFNGETSRLRYVDQQIRQQRALQQLGMLQQHAWRPQRGLPERAVSVLRAWLFEHFLHPYPKDVDKMSLAKQTGLTRSQVSNWFINARVRLWKPMVEEMYVEEQREAADLVMQSDRMAREQVMHNSPYEPYEGSSRGRSNSSLQDELNNTNGQHSGMPNDFRCSADDGREHDLAGPSVNNITEVQQSQVLFRQQDIAAAEHSFNFENTREAKRSKTALETVSDAFNNTSMLIMHSTDGENSAKFPSSGSTNDDTDMEARKLKGKCVAEQEHEQEPYVSGAFVSYNDGNNMNHVHRYETVTGFGAPRVAPTAGTGVSLTLGLRHCDANMRPSAGSVAPILEKYDMDVDIARMDPLDREAYLHEGRVREITADGQYEMQRDQQEENTSNLTREILPGGTGMANPPFDHHHEFNDDH